MEPKIPVWDSFILWKSSREKAKKKKNSACLRLLIRYGILLLCVIPAYARSLGLGDITVNSPLNAPLRAKIELLAVDPEELKMVRIQLASPQEFDNIGIRRSEILNRLKFERPIIIGNKAYTTVNTKLPVRERDLNFLVEVKWPRGRLLREYTIHLIASSPTVESVRTVTKRQSSADQQLPLFRSENSQKLVEKNTQTHLSNAVITGTPSTAQSKHDKQAQSLSHRTYKSVSGDALITIARKFFPNTEFEVHQLMIAIVKANSSAFIEGNINGLRADVDLTLPTPHEINQINPAQALAEVNRQNNQWRNKNSQKRVFDPSQQIAPHDTTLKKADSLFGPAATAVNEADTLSKLEKTGNQDHQETIERQSSVADKLETDKNARILPSAQSGGRLTIYATNNINDFQTTDALTTGDYIASLEKSATLAQELATSRQQETLEIKDRLGRLESMMTQQERLITLQNDQLAELQKRIKYSEHARQISEQKKWWWLLTGLFFPALPLLYLLYRLYWRATIHQSVAVEG